MQASNEVEPVIWLFRNLGQGAVGWLPSGTPVQYLISLNCCAPIQFSPKLRKSRRIIWLLRTLPFPCNL